MITKPARPAVKPGTSRDLYLNAQAALLINMSTGDVYYEHNPDKAIQRLKTVLHIVPPNNPYYSKSKKLLERLRPGAGGGGGSGDGF